MSVQLVGGGWSAEHHRSVYGAFVRESVTTATDRSSTTARVGVLQLFDRSVEDGEAKFGQFADILTRLGPCRAVPFLVAEEESLPPGMIGDVDGLLVAGGLTPAYQAALAPVAEEIGELVARGVPYLGFSAGAAVAATMAVIGGWRDGEVTIAGAGQAWWVTRARAGATVRAARATTIARSALHA